MPGLWDRRQDHRVDYSTTVCLLPLDRDRTIVGKTVDLSAGGIRVTAAQLCPVQTEVICDLPLPNDRLTVRGRVKWIAPEQLGVDAMMGVQFVDLSSFDANTLQRFVGSAPAQRETSTVKVWFEGMAEPVRAEAQRTENGLRFRTELPFLRLESAVTFSMREAAGEAYRGRVRRVRLEAPKNGGVPQLEIEVEQSGDSTALPMPERNNIKSRSLSEGDILELISADESGGVEESFVEEVTPHGDALLAGGITLRGQGRFVSARMMPGMSQAAELDAAGLPKVPDTLPDPAARIAPGSRQGRRFAAGEETEAEGESERDAFPLSSNMGAASAAEWLASRDELKFLAQPKGSSASESSSVDDSGEEQAEWSPPSARQQGPEGWSLSGSAESTNSLPLFWEDNRPRPHRWIWTLALLMAAVAAASAVQTDVFRRARSWWVQNSRTESSTRSAPTAEPVSSPSSPRNTVAAEQPMQRTQVLEPQTKNPAPEIRKDVAATTRRVLERRPTDGVETAPLPTAPHNRPKENSSQELAVEQQGKNRIVVSFNGSTQGSSSYRIMDPEGLVVKLPHATPRMPFGDYPVHRSGVRILWVRPLARGGLQLRFIFGKEPLGHDLSIKPGRVELVLSPNRPTP